MDKDIVTLSDLLEGVGHHVQEIQTFYGAQLDDLIHRRILENAGLSCEELKSVRQLSHLVPSKHLESECAALLEMLQQIRTDNVVTSLTDRSIQNNVLHTVRELDIYAQRLPTKGNLEDLEMMSGLEARLRKALLPFAREAVGYDHITSLRTEYAFRTIAIDRLTRYFLTQKKDSGTPASFSNADVTLAMIDFNDFKLLNDKAGHRQADVLIQQFGSLFKNMIDEIPTMVGARCYKAGDEFYFLINGLNSEDAQRFVRERFIPQVCNSDRLFTLVRDEMKRRSLLYSSGFENAGYRFSVSIGITSTMIGDCSVLNRVSRYLSEDGPQSDTRRLVREGLERGLVPADITQSIPEHYRPDFVRAVYTMLETEAEAAMYVAKEVRGKQGQSIVCAYDAKNPLKTPCEKLPPAKLPDLLPCGTLTEVRR